MHEENTDLLARRLAAVRAWTAFVEHGDGRELLVRPEIYSQLDALRRVDHHRRHAAPLADEADTRAFWQGSPLQIAVSRVEDDLRRTAEDGDLVLAVTDADTRILWTYGGRVMRRKAESVNFVAGGRWDDESVGTNALDLANRTAPAVDGVLGRALRLDRAQLGVLGRARQRPGHRAAARRHRPLDHVGPHPPHRPGDRARDGPADRAGDAALPRAPGPVAGRRVARRRRPDAAAARHRRGPPRRPAAAAEPAADRDPRAARDEPRRASRSSACTPSSTATTA